MKPYILLSIILLFPHKQLIFAQGNPPKVSIKEYYNFFNSFINPDSIESFNLSSKPDFEYIYEDTSDIFRDTNIFSSLDVQFIKSQILNAVGFEWENHKILASNVINAKEISKIFADGTYLGWSEFNKKYKNGFSTFSVPLFSVDGKLCIVYTARHCGHLCGEGSTNIYKKVRGKWVWLKAVGTRWVS